MIKEINCERNNLFEPNDYIHFLVTLRGEIEPATLQAAILSAYEANESTCSRIVLTEDGCAYYEKCEETGCKVLITQESWEKLIIKNEKQPFAIQNGEMIRSFIIGGIEKTQLLIMAHHLVGDGKSIVYFIEDVMKALSGEKLEFRPIYSVSQSEFYHKAKMSPKVRLFLKYMNRAWSKEKKVFGWKDYEKIHHTYWNKHSSHILYHIFSREETAQVIEMAKKIGISVNSYLITAFQKTDVKNQIIGIPLSVREDNNKSMCNQTSGISITYQYSEKMTFVENAKNVHTMIQKALKSPRRYFVLRFIPSIEPTLLDGAVLSTQGYCHASTAKKIAEVMGYAGNGTRDLGITNLTRLDIPDKYGAYQIEDILFVPPAISYNPKSIGVATINGKMALGYRVMDETLVEKEKKFFEKACHYTRSL